MTAINRLSAVDSIASTDLFPVWSNGSADARKAAASVLLAYMQANLTFTSQGAGIVEYATQRSAPSATGFSVAITDDDDSTHLILTPVAGYAAGTIVLPAVANAIDKQRVLVNCTQAVTTLTVDKNGATAVTGAPTTLAANGFFTLKYDLPTLTWYRVS